MRGATFILTQNSNSAYSKLPSYSFWIPGLRSGGFMGPNRFLAATAGRSDPKIRFGPAKPRERTPDRRAKKVWEGVFGYGESEFVVRMSVAPRVGL